MPVYARCLLCVQPSLIFLFFVFNNLEGWWCSIFVRKQTDFKVKWLFQVDPACLQWRWDSNLLSSDSTASCQHTSVPLTIHSVRIWSLSPQNLLHTSVVIDLDLIVAYIQKSILKNGIEVQAMFLNSSSLFFPCLNSLWVFPSEEAQ